MKRSFKREILKKKKPAKKLIAVRIPVEIESQLKAIAKKSGRTMSDVVVEALRYSLELSV
jgi:predicted DNA-binding protein